MFCFGLRHEVVGGSRVDNGAPGHPVINPDFTYKDCIPLTSPFLSLSFGKQASIPVPIGESVQYSQLAIFLFLPSHIRLLSSFQILLGRHRVPAFCGHSVSWSAHAYEARQGALTLTMIVLAVRSLPWSSTSLLGGLAFSSSFKSVISPTFGGVGSITFISTICGHLVPSYR